MSLSLSLSLPRTHFAVNIDAAVNVDTAPAAARGAFAIAGFFFIAVPVLVVAGTEV